MILLTDEEMHKVIPGYIDFPATEDGEIDWLHSRCGRGPLSQIHRDIAKAQLKKVAEWVEENSYETTDECDLSGDIILAIKVKDWQALLKEVKDD